MSKLRYGLCGLGFMGQAHLKCILDDPDAELVAICDRDAQRHHGKSASGGNLDYGEADPSALENIPAYTDPADLLADKNVDAVVLALPTHVHGEIAPAALLAGKHVLCEKPMACRVGECDRMLDAARQSGKTLMIGQCLRFWPHYEKVRELIESGRIGGVRYMCLRRLGTAPQWSAGGWLMDAEKSGGAILDLHVHDIDYAQSLVGLPLSVYAHGQSGPSGGIDHVVATYGYKGGVYAVIEGGWTLMPPRPFEMSILVQGEQGTIEWSSVDGDDVLLYAGGKTPERFHCEGDALAAQLGYFTRCVLAGEPVSRCTPESSRTSVALSWLERRAVETGRVVPLSDTLRRAWQG